ncbi:hypothetical protein [Paludibacterium sp. B53371]|uniref:hypothetical protein n=1 Tax=Paludibacterium sp. B53371 TaxID=2806263 RepID=UPI001C056859|nr:hypothetical protein [Paludibacterium sp. B53371]
MSLTIRLMVLLFPALAAAASDYQISLEPAHPERAHAVLTLGADQSAAGWLSLRGQRWGLTPQIAQVRCGARPLRRQGDRWRKPAGCRTIRWEVHFARAQAGELDPSRQQSLYFPGEARWLFSESVSLLRPERDPDAGLRIAGVPAAQVFGGGQVQGDRWPLPETGQAPAFFALGSWPVLSSSSSLTVLADQPARFAALGLTSLQQQALSYQQSLLQLPVTEPLLLVWLQMAVSQGRVAGAAGKASLLAGYLVPEGEMLVRRQAQSLMTVAHEQFHLLAAQKGLAAHPAWYDESLAQYYALKTLQHSALPTALTTALSARFVDENRPVERGLLQWQQAYQAGDPAAYPWFYTQGATFWSALDRLLMQASAGKHGLDQDLPSLLQVPTDDDAPLPPDLLRQWRALLGARLDAQLQRYLSTTVQRTG